jgi:hypothetical protein
MGAALGGVDGMRGSVDGRREQVNGSVRVSKDGHSDGVHGMVAFATLQAALKE